VIGAGRW